MASTEGSAESLAAEEARRLWEEGLSVIPLGSPGEDPPPWFIERCESLEEARDKWPKTPRVKWQPFQKRQPSEHELEAWIRNWPACNWAILTGQHLVVVDADNAEAAAFMESGAVTRTPRKVTTAKGAHFYYQASSRLPIRNSANPHSKIDIRGHGGYVVAPGSVHATGVIYTEETVDGWGDTSYGELPMLTEQDLQAVAEFNGLTLQSNGQFRPGVANGNLGGFDAAQVRPSADGAPVAEGGRNNAAASLTGRYIAEGHDARTIKQLLDSWNQQNPTPLPQDELNRTVASVMQTHVRNHPGEPIATAPGVDAAAEITQQQASILPKLGATSVARWQGVDVAERRWVWPSWIPIGQTTGFYAAGGTGKTLLAQQMATAMAAGKPFLGNEIAQGPALCIFCEDDDQELHRRQEALNGLLSVSYGELADLHVLSRIGQDNLLMTFKNDKGSLTPFWYQLAELVGDLGPQFLIVDTAADTFAGNEMHRGQVRQFIQGALTHLAVEFGCAVMLCAHPSMAGIASGKGSGGSTAWENTMRSRLYMIEDEITGLRTLSRVKSNYAPKNESVEFYWHEGGFIPAAQADFELTIDQIAQRDFLAILDRMTEQQNYPSASPNSQSYAPKMFTKYASNIRGKYQTIGQATYEKAMHQLLEDEHIEIFSDKRNKITSRIQRIGGQA